MLQNYLKSISFKWNHEESKKFYFNVMTDIYIRTFEKLYRDREDLREDFGNTVGKSIEALITSISIS